MRQMMRHDSETIPPSVCGQLELSTCALQSPKLVFLAHSELQMRPGMFWLDDMSLVSVAFVSVMQLLLLPDPVPLPKLRLYRSRYCR